MILPSTQTERFALFRNVIRECKASQEDRRARYRQMRLWYLTGSDDGQRARHNKLLEHVAYSSAYLYAPADVKFGVMLPPHYGEQWMPECEAAREELHRLFHDTDAGLVYDQQVTWAHSYDTMLSKVITSANEARLELVPDPSDIGVWNEASDDWDTQEAVTHSYLLDVPRFARMVQFLPEKRRAELIQMAETHAMPGYEAQSETLPPTVQRTIILSQASPNMIGAVQGLAVASAAIPQVNAPMVKMTELWIKDDARHDYRVVTHLGATEEILWEPWNPLVPGEHPFHPLSLIPTPGYIWGMAPLEYLVMMQKWREDKMRQLDDRDDRLIDPPMFFKGFTTITDEQALRFRTKGGTIATQNPTAEVTPFPPQQVAEPFAMIDRIDTDFARQGALPKGMMGQTEPGVRSGEQAMDQAILAAGPTMKKAMFVEATLSAIATQMLRLRRRISTDTLVKVENHRPSEFLLSQIPGDVVAKVWAHSSSPLYTQRTTQKAMWAYEKQLIDKEDALEYLDLPMTESRLKAKARHMEEAAAERQKELLDIKKKETEAKVLKATK